MRIIFVTHQYRYGDLKAYVRCKGVSYYVHAKATRTPFVIIIG